MPMPSEPTAMPVTRRERLRDLTMAEIKATARRHLVASGPEALSLRAVARDMGLTAPALYRYVDSRDDLLTEVIAELYDELTSSLQAAVDAQPADEVGRRLVAASWELRAWAQAHPTEFGLLFGSPLPGYAVPSEGVTHEAGRRFAMVFAALFAELWQRRPFPCDRTEDLDPVLASQLAAYAESMGSPLPPGAIKVFLECWVRLYGLVCMEVFGHLKFALDDAGAMFADMLRTNGLALGFAELEVQTSMDSPGASRR
jgi:AcrR family transcriptional regulator